MVVERMPCAVSTSGCGGRRKEEGGRRGGTVPGSDSGIPIRSACVLTPLHMALSSSFSLSFLPLFPPGFKLFYFQFNSVIFYYSRFHVPFTHPSTQEKKPLLLRKLYLHTQRKGRGDYVVSGAVAYWELTIWVQSTAWNNKVL